MKCIILYLKEGKLNCVNTYKTLLHSLPLDQLSNRIKSYFLLHKQIRKYAESKKSYKPANPVCGEPLGQWEQNGEPIRSKQQ